MALKLITAPATEPVTLAEAKLQCSIDADLTAHDARFETVLIPAAVADAEHLLGDRALITQTWEAVYDAFPAAELYLGKPPVQSISSVKYIDTAGDEQTLSSSAYSLDNETDKAFILPAIDTEWPDTLDTTNAVRVRFVCGYGAASDVPALIRSYILLHIEYSYRRESMPDFVARLLDRYKVY